MTRRLWDPQKKSPKHLTFFWALIGLSLIALSALLAAYSYLFGYDYRVDQMPVFWLVGGLAIAGLIYQPLPYLIRKILSRDIKNPTSLLLTMVAFGVVMRLLFIASEPVLEDDYQRYLWDGAVTANGFNPYAFSPKAARSGEPIDPRLRELSAQSDVVIKRINHQELRTIYPPVAQAVFALSHWLKPWSLITWRGLILTFDIITLWILIHLLHAVGRSPLWASLYWWNPVVIKELFNSAHMEAILLPLVLGALLLAIRKRTMLAVTSLALAAGTKLWPALLLPLLLRPLLNNLRLFFWSLGLVALIGILCVLPILLAGFDSSSGFIAYAKNWRTNSALFPAVEGLVQGILTFFNWSNINAGLAARVIIGAVLIGIVYWQSQTGFENAEDLLKRTTLIVTALFLLSPAQFPWYYLWVVPFLPFTPQRGLVLLTIMLPLYYLGFYYLANDTYYIFSNIIVWIIWIPVWGLLAYDLMPHIRKPENTGAPVEREREKGTL